MAGKIYHEWNGTVLTITSDSGTSSADLKGGQGDTGPRGPQGRAGVILSEDGSVDMTGYATETYVNEMVSNADINVDLTGYATEAYVNTEIAEVLDKIPLIPENISEFTNDADYATKKEVDEAVSNVEVDLTGYATEAYVDKSIANIKASEPDLTDYATKEYVDTQIVNVATGGSIDLGNYATKSDVHQLTIPYVIQDATPSALTASDVDFLVKYATAWYEIKTGEKISHPEYLRPLYFAYAPNPTHPAYCPPIMIQANIQSSGAYNKTYVLEMTYHTGPFRIAVHYRILSDASSVTVDTDNSSYHQYYIEETFIEPEA